MICTALLEEERGYVVHEIKLIFYDIKEMINRAFRIMHNIYY